MTCSLGIQKSKRDSDLANCPYLKPFLRTTQTEVPSASRSSATESMRLTCQHDYHRHEHHHSTTTMAAPQPSAAKESLRVTRDGLIEGFSACIYLRLPCAALRCEALSCCRNPKHEPEQTELQEPTGILRTLKPALPLPAMLSASTLRAVF